MIMIMTMIMIMVIISATVRYKVRMICTWGFNSYRIANDFEF